jgi:PAS domain-containing protein
MSTRIVPAAASVRTGRAAQHGARSATQHVKQQAHALATEMAERQALEQTLRRSEQELADFFDHAPMALHWVGPDGIILRVNEAELRLLGYTRDAYAPASHPHHPL